MSCPALGPFTNLKGLQFYRDDDDDPYVTLKEVRAAVHIAMYLINMRDV
jgi:periodic tryptophan protein 1